MSFKYNAEESFPSLPESFVVFTINGAAQRADDKTLALTYPSLVGHSFLLPTNDESQTPVNNIAVSSQLGDPVHHTNGYLLLYYSWVTLEEIHSEQSLSGSGMTSYISPSSVDKNQQVEILFHQQTAQSSGTCGLQECASVKNDKVHANNCHDKGVFKQLTDSDSENFVMSSHFFPETGKSYWRNDVTLVGPTEVAAKSRNSKSSQVSKMARKRRGECRGELECIAKRHRLDDKVGYTPCFLSKVDEATTEITQLAPSCGQVVEVLRRSIIDHGQDIVYVQNGVTPWEPWVTALRDEEGTLTVSPCSSRSSLIEMDGDIKMKMMKEKMNGKTAPSLQQCSSHEAQAASLHMHVKDDLKGTCHQIVGSPSAMLPSLHKSEDDDLNQMQDNNIDSCIVVDTWEDIYETLMDDNYSDESLNSLHLFEELRDLESEEMVLQETGTFENTINRFSYPQKHCGKVLSDNECVSCDITPEQGHIQDKCAFLLLEVEKELRKMGIRGFSVRLNIDWHQLVVEDSYFGNTFIFPLYEVDFNDRNPVFEDILNRLTKDMYSILSCASNHEDRV